MGIVGGGEGKQKGKREHSELVGKRVVGNQAGGVRP